MLSQGGSSSSSPSNSSTPENIFKDEKKKKSIIPKIFSSKKFGKESSEEDATLSDGNDHDLDFKMTPRMKVLLDESPSKKDLLERHSSVRIESLNLSNFDQPMAPATIVQDIRIFVATWNVGGKTPSQCLNLEDFLQVEGPSDIYVLGFQEIVPLNAGNVLVTEDNEPAAKWIALISQALNKTYHESLNSCPESATHHHSTKHVKNSSPKDSKHNNNHHKDNNLFQKPCLKMLRKTLKADSRKLKSCNCQLNSSSSSSSSSSPPPLSATTAAVNGRPRNYCDPSATPYVDRRQQQMEKKDPICIDENYNILELATKLPSRNLLDYRLIATKQMVGIFLSVWARKELVQDIGHLRISSVGRGIMGYLGNKGCIAVSLSLYQTSFCFVCSHLASGEKEGDELKRNADVSEILKSTQFPHLCKNSNHLIPERILDHDRVIWFGDLNYRVALSYEETKLLLEENNWDSLLEKDQLNLERAGGRVFSGFNEGRIVFAPTYKYSHNSDSYAGETVKSKKKRRTPAWCDRILWKGNGIDQSLYIRGESRFSDHRPVCAIFTVEVEIKNVKNINPKFRKGYSCIGTKPGYEESMPQRQRFHEL